MKQVFCADKYHAVQRVCHYNSIQQRGDKKHKTQAAATITKQRKVTIRNGNYLSMVAHRWDEDYFQKNNGQNAAQLQKNNRKPERTENNNFNFI